MDDRSRVFITRVRKALNDAGENNIQDEEIYDSGNLAQTQIMLRTASVEKEFTINFKVNKNGYDFEDESAFFINRLTPSWDGDIDYIESPSEFEGYKSETGSYPTKMTIYGDKVYFYPVPSDSTNKIDIWALQREVIAPMDDDIPPEIPKRCDLALRYWAIADLAPGAIDKQSQRSYFELFLDQIKLINSRGRNKIALPLETKPNW